MRTLLSFATLILFFAVPIFSVQSNAQAEPKLPKATGVSESAVKHPMSELSPEAVFPVAGHPDWMAITEDSMWVTSSSANHVVRLDIKTNKATEVITLPKPCSGLAIGFGSLWIPSCGDHTLVRADQKTGAVQATIKSGPADSEGGITTGAGSVWLVSSGSSVLDRIDPATNTVVAQITLPKGSFNPIFAGDSVWVASNEGNSLVRVDPATNKVVGTTPIGIKPRFLTVGAGSIWVLNQGDGTVSRIDGNTGKLIATIPAGLSGAGGEIAFGAGSVWATLFGFPITRIDPGTNKVVQQWTGEGGDSIRVAHDSVWLTFLMGAKVWRLKVPAL